jgi:hypothetical protein
MVVAVRWYAWGGPFGCLVVQQRKLLNDRDKFILQVKLLPGFESFLMAPSFDPLHSAVAHALVVIIYHCKWSSDVIILIHDSLL